MLTLHNLKMQVRRVGVWCISGLCRHGTRPARVWDSRRIMSTWNKTGGVARFSINWNQSRPQRAATECGIEIFGIIPRPRWFLALLAKNLARSGAAIPAGLYRIRFLGVLDTCKGVFMVFWWFPHHWPVRPGRPRGAAWSVGPARPRHRRRLVAYPQGSQLIVAEAGVTGRIPGRYPRFRVQKFEFFTNFRTRKFAKIRVEFSNIFGLTSSKIFWRKICLIFRQNFSWHVNTFFQVISDITRYLLKWYKIWSKMWIGQF